MTTAPPPPRRKRHFAVAMLAWSGWEAYAFRSALKQAQALGLVVGYTDPAKEIRKNWKAVFEKKTWLDGVTLLVIPEGRDLERLGGTKGS